MLSAVQDGLFEGCVHAFLNMRKNSTRQNTRRRAAPPPQRHRWVDQWLVARGQPLRTMVDEVVALVALREEQQGLRQRARRPADAVNHLASINVIVSNLAYAVLVPPSTGRLAISTRNAAGTRYDNRALGPKPLRALLSNLEELELLECRWTKRRGESSSIHPLSRCAEMVHQLGVTLADFGRDEDEELIVLARNTARPQGAAKHREMVNYAETETTALYRAQVRGLNAFLSSADVAFEDDGFAPTVDCHQRGLRRHFTILKDQPEQFDQSGRLFGGFWMAMKSSRRPGIRINGEPVVELDYSSMFTRLAYAALGASPPAGDLYAIDGAMDHRSGIKMAMNIFLFDTNLRRSKWPSEMGVGVGDDREAIDGTVHPATAYDGLLPKGWTVAVTRKAILKKHPALKPAWGRGLGYRLMFEESRIMLAVLESLRAQNIPALPLHDGLLVPRSSSRIARMVMEQISEQITGIELPVSEKRIHPR